MLAFLGAAWLSQGAVGDSHESAEPAPPGEIRFIGKNSITTARGTFHRWHFSSVTHRAAAPGLAEVVVEVDLESVDTGSGRRDRHLRTDDFFDIEQYPTARLRFYDIEPHGEPEEGSVFSATLDFDLHGIQKTYPGFEFKVVGADPVRVEGSFEFNRLDFEVGKPKTWNPMSIREEIPVEFSAQLPPPGVGG